MNQDLKTMNNFKIILDLDLKMVVLLYMMKMEVGMMNTKIIMIEMEKLLTLLLMMIFLIFLTIYQMNIKKIVKCTMKKIMEINNLKKKSKERQILNNLIEFQTILETMMKYRSNSSICQNKLRREILDHFSVMIEFKLLRYF